MAVGGLNSLGAVEPERSRNINDKVPGNDTSVVGRVELIEAGVESSCFGRAGSIEVRLCDSVVGAVEIETDSIADVSIDLISAEFEETVDADDHGVCCGCGLGGCS